MAPTRSAASTTTAALLVGITTFQVGLAAGMPWGVASYGGRNKGRLPVNLRRVSGVAAAVYAVGAFYVASDIGSATLRRRVLTGLTGYMAVGALTNLASPSALERALWVPVCVATGSAAWIARSAS